MQPAHLRIRQAVSADLPAIRDCAQKAYVQYVALIGRKPAPMIADFAEHIARNEAYVAELSEKKIAGYVICIPTKNALQLENVAVFPDATGKGIGKALIRFCETLARQEGKTSVTLYTNAKMTANLKLYPFLGYAEVDRRQEDGFDRVYYEKSLS